MVFIATRLCDDIQDHWIFKMMSSVVQKTSLKFATLKKAYEEDQKTNNEKNSSFSWVQLSAPTSKPFLPPIHIKHQQPLPRQ